MASIHSLATFGVEDTISISNQVRDQPQGISDPRDAVRSSLSASGFTRRLSQKLRIFEPPTVIHRTNARVRIKIANVDDSSSFISFGNEDDMLQKSTNPSTSTPGSESPPSSRITSQTSLDGMSPYLTPSSPQEEMASERTWRLFPRCGDRGVATDQHSVSKGDPVKLNPTIVTVEATATAKIFFENHFNSLFKGPDTRSKRLQELEEQLSTLPFTAKERRKARKVWVTQESECLRQTRFLKAQSNRIHSKESVSIAGYEIIRVLGRGSFGVVRLVKDKTDSSRGSQAEMEKYAVQRETPETNSSRLGHAVRNTRVSRGTVPLKNKTVYAMKAIRKSDMIRLGQEGHLRAERDFLVASERSKWIVPLRASFQDKHYLYLVMDYMVGR